MGRQRKTRRQILIFAAAVALAVAAAATAVGLTHADDTVAGHPAASTGTPTNPAPATSTTSSTSRPVTVASGGTVSLPDGTRVVIGAGAVSEDTTLTVSHDGTPPSPGSGLDPAGDPVHIELAAGQLTGTAELTVPAAAPPGWPTTVTFTPLLAYYDDDAGVWTAVSATWDSATGMLTAQVNHFSWWNPLTWDYKAIGNAVRQAMADMVSVPSGIKPACGNPAPPSTVKVTGSGTALLDYCVDQTGGQLLLRTRAKPDFPLMLSWAGTAKLATRPEYGLDLSSVYRWLASQQGLQAANAVVVPTGGEVDLTVAPDSNAPVLVTATYDSSMQLVGIVDATARVILALRSALGIATTAETVANAVVDTGCFVQNIGGLARNPAGTFTTLLLGCLKDAVTAMTKHAGGLVRLLGWGVGVIGSLLGVVGYAVNQVVSLFYAGKAVLTGRTDEQLTLAAPGSPTAAPTGPAGTASTWPVHDNEGPPVLYAWFGASFEFPDWVSCSYDGAWCIAGIGDAVHIMRIHNLSDLGSVPLATRDPVAELVSAGFTRTVANQLVAPGCPANDTC